MLMGRLEDKWNSEAFRGESVRRMTEAVEIPTVAFDDMGDVGVDGRWGVFEGFHVGAISCFGGGC